MNATDKKRYTMMENVLNTINSKHISLPESETKRNNKILDKLTNSVLEHMKRKDVLFKAMFERNFYGGSYYDNLKVGKPNEFDLDFVMKIPVIVEPKLSCSEYPGFVKVQVSAFHKLETRAEKPQYEKLPSLLDQGNYLCINKVLVWMERVLVSALNELPQDEIGSYVEIDLDDRETIRVYAKMCKGPPAFTMKMFGKDKNGDIQLDIDLVPCFQFADDKWPDASQGYRRNPSQTKKKFLVVPKKPKYGIKENDSKVERYWRLSFQEQERELITGPNLKVLKPSLKLLKKLRDRQAHKIASYYIKTLYLWALETEPKSFWAQPLSCVFMMMLKMYAAHLKDQKIPYYWNPRHNLIDYLKQPTKIDIGNSLKRIIEDVEWNLQESNANPFIIGKYMLLEADYKQLHKTVVVGKKFERRLSGNTSCDSTDSKMNLTADEERLVKVCSESYEKEKQQLRVLASPDADDFQSTVLKYLTKINENVDTMKGEINDLRETKTNLVTQCNSLVNKVTYLERQIDQLRIQNEQLLKRTMSQSGIGAILDNFL